MANSLTGLIVDPNTNMQSMIAGMLRSMVEQKSRLFKELKKATSFQAACALTNNDEKIDMVICDVDICGYHEGIRFLRECRRDAKNKYLPFIMTTGAATVDIIPALVGAIREWGAHFLLVKPFAQAVLEDKVQRVIKKVNSSEEMIYRKIGNAPPPEALATICKLEEKGFCGPKLSNIAGEKHLEAGEKEKAADRFQQAIAESEAAFLMGLRNYAAVQEDLGNTEEVLMTLEKLDTLSPLDVERKVKLGGLFLQMGMEEKGRAALNQALVLARKGGEEAAVKAKVDFILASVQAEDPDVKAIRENLHDLKLCNEIALKLRKEGKFDRAEACYDMILAQHPNNPTVLYNKAVLFMAMGRFQDAATILGDVIAHAPQFKKAAEALELCRNRAQCSP